MSLARIIVSLNIRESLRKELNITDMGRSQIQILNYEGVPFRYHHCHEHGHISKYCSLPFPDCYENPTLSGARKHQGLYASACLNTLFSYLGTSS